MVIWIIFRLWVSCFCCPCVWDMAMLVVTQKSLLLEIHWVTNKSAFSFLQSRSLSYDFILILAWMPSDRLFYLVNPNHSKNKPCPPTQNHTNQQVKPPEQKLNSGFAELNLQCLSSQSKLPCLRQHLKSFYAVCECIMSFIV